MGLQQPGQRGSLAVDCVLLVLVVLYCVQTALDLALTIQASRKMAAGQEKEDAFGAGSHKDLIEEAMQRWSRKTKRAFSGGRRLHQTPLGYRPEVSVQHMVLELVMCSLMVASLHLLVMTATQLTDQVPTLTEVKMYDTSTVAPCHPFMMFKQEPGAGAGVGGSLQAGSSSGGNTSSGGSSSNSSSGGSSIQGYNSSSTPLPLPPPPQANATGGSIDNSSSSSGSNGSSPMANTTPGRRQRSLLQGGMTLTDAEITAISALEAAAAGNGSGSGSSATATAAATATTLPGTAGRWKLEDDPSGLQQLGQMYHDLDAMSTPVVRLSTDPLTDPDSPPLTLALPLTLPLTLNLTLTPDPDPDPDFPSLRHHGPPPPPPQVLYGLLQSIMLILLILPPLPPPPWCRMASCKALRSSC